MLCFNFYCSFERNINLKELNHVTGSFLSEAHLHLLCCLQLEAIQKKSCPGIGYYSHDEEKILRHLQCLVFLFDCTHVKLNMYKQTFMCLCVTIPKSILNGTETWLIPLSTPLFLPQKLNSFKSIKFFCQ